MQTAEVKRQQANAPLDHDKNHYKKESGYWQTDSLRVESVFDGAARAQSIGG
jgi:hypothetical protein